MHGAQEGESQAIVVHGPEVLRIGLPKYDYMYTRLDADTWVCPRGSNWAGLEERLALKRTLSGLWTAFDAVYSGTAEAEGIPVQSSGRMEIRFQKESTFVNSTGIEADRLQTGDLCRYLSRPRIYSESVRLS